MARIDDHYTGTVRRRHHRGEPGALNTFQDLGRIGYQQFGVPANGVMDERAPPAGQCAGRQYAGHRDP